MKQEDELGDSDGGKAWLRCMVLDTREEYHRFFNIDVTEGCWRAIRRVLDRCMLMTLGLVVGCQVENSSGTEGISMKPSAPVPVGSAAAPSASVGNAPLAPADASVEAGTAGASHAATAALDEAVLERRTFRQLVAGSLVYPARRMTWALFRGGARARLKVLCQMGPEKPEIGLSLTGKENDESLWGAPTLTEYVGARTSERPLSYRFEAASGAVGKGKCQTMPSVLFFSCRPEQVPVLRAGAALIPGHERSGRRPRWDPPASEQVASLRCDVSKEGSSPEKPFDDEPFRFLWPGWPLVFAAPKGAAPGIEWAHENSDMVVQEGAYRWMPAP